MASLQKRKGSPFYWGSYKSDNKWRFRSTGEADKAAARKVLASWDKAAAAVCSSPQQARRVIRDIVVRDLGRDQVLISTKDYLTRWLKALEGTMGYRSFQHHETTVREWLEYMGAAAEEDISTVSPEQITAWRTSEVPRISISTINQKMKVLRRVFKRAEDEEYCHRSPTRNIAPLKELRAKFEKRNGEIVPTGPQKFRRAFTVDEIYKLESHMPDDWKLILWMGLLTGQRFGDILTFEWSNISFPNKSMNLIQGKTARRMWLPAADELLERLEAWRNQQTERSRFLFHDLADMVISAHGQVAQASSRFAGFLWEAGLRKDPPFTPRRTRSKKALRAAAAAGEVLRTDDKRTQRELSFHCLRYTARTWMEEAGIPKAVIDAYLGHEGRQGETYTTVGHDALRLALAELSARAKKRKMTKVKRGTFRVKPTGSGLQIQVA